MKKPNTLVAGAAVIGTIVLAIAIARIDWNGAKVGETATLRDGKPAAPPLAIPKNPVSEGPQRPQSAAAGLHATALTDLGSRFAASKDYFSFIEGALESATSGNPRAQYLIGRAMRSCRGTVLMYKKRPDPRAAFEQDLAKGKGSAEEIADSIEEARRAFDRCERLIVQDPFVNLPPRTDGEYSAKYWEDEAIRNGDPLAKAARGAEGAANLGNTEAPRERAVAVGNVVNLFSDAVLSGEPAAVMRVASSYADHTFAPDLRTSIALTIVACAQGLDCSTGNKTIFANCIERGTCATGDTYTEYIGRSVGAETYAASYALAQRLQYAIANRDREAIAQLLSPRAP